MRSTVSRLQAMALTGLLTLLPIIASAGGGSFDDVPGSDGDYTQSAVQSDSGDAQSSQQSAGDGGVHDGGWGGGFAGVPGSEPADIGGPSSLGASAATQHEAEVPEQPGGDDTYAPEPTRSEPAHRPARSHRDAGAADHSPSRPSKPVGPAPRCHAQVADQTARQAEKPKATGGPQTRPLRHGRVAGLTATSATRGPALAPPTPTAPMARREHGPRRWPLALVTLAMVAALAWALRTVRRPRHGGAHVEPIERTETADRTVTVWPLREAAAEPVMAQTDEPEPDGAGEPVAAAPVESAEPEAIPAVRPMSFVHVANGAPGSAMPTRPRTQAGDPNWARATGRPRRARVSCRHCGGDNPERMGFCLSCGMPLAQAARAGVLDHAGIS